MSGYDKVLKVYGLTDDIKTWTPEAGFQDRKEPYFVTHGVNMMEVGKVSFGRGRGRCLYCMRRCARRMALLHSPPTPQPPTFPTPNPSIR